MTCCTTSPDSKPCAESEMDPEALAILDNICGRVDFLGKKLGVMKDCDSAVKSFLPRQGFPQEGTSGAEQKVGAASPGITCKVKPGTPNTCVFNREATATSGDIIYSNLNTNRDGICVMAHDKAACQHLGDVLSVPLTPGVWTPFCYWADHDAQCKGSTKALPSNIPLCHATEPVTDCSEVSPGTHCYLAYDRSKPDASHVVGKCALDKFGYNCRPFFA